MNSQVINEIREAFKLQPSTEKIPSALPVIEVGVKSVKNAIIKSTQSTSTGTLSLIAATDYLNQDVYIHSVSLSIIKDVACDIATGNINVSCQINGAIKLLTGLAVITATAQERCISVSFPHPIKIDRGSSVYSSVTTTAGVLVRVASVTYSVDETSNA